MLKNNGVLPFRKDVKRVALIGPFAEEKHLNGFWSRPGAEQYTVTLPEGIQNLLPEAELVIEKGCGAGFDAALKQRPPPPRMQTPSSLRWVNLRTAAGKEEAARN